MEESTDTSQTPKPNEFVIAEHTAYGTTDVEIWEIAEYLMTGLELVKLEDLDPDDRVCSICQEEFIVSEDVRPSHAPVKIECGHIFGRKCIIRWFNPLCTWAFLIAHHAANRGTDLLGNSGCPMCRRECFPDVLIEPVELLASRLSFWDRAYAGAGVARSEKEERSREDLRQYIEYCRLVDVEEDEPDLGWDLDLYKHAQDRLLELVKFLKTQTLTPEQEILRRKLERIGRKDLEICPLEDVFTTDNDDNERVDFANEQRETDTEMGWESDSEQDQSDGG